MKRALRISLMLLSIALFSFPLYAQMVNISYVNPDDLSVCDSATFEVTVTNNLQDTIKNVTVSSDMPSGLLYILSSVVTASESDVSNLNVPVFSLPEMEPGAIQTFQFQAQTDCSLIDAINNGTLFTNTYTVNYDGGTKSETTIPYIIETPLVLITNITNALANGTKGDVIIRTITFTNTRLGALSKVTVTDQNNSGIDITTDLGMVSNATPTNYEVMLTGTDFQNFGDGDDLFELNEEITLTQEILITDCGFDMSVVNSTISVSWGCNGMVCQTETVSASINLAPSQDNPNLEFEPIVELPTDYCGGEPVQQGIQITNHGSQPATNIWVNINHNGDGVMGIADQSFRIDSAGLVNPIDAVYSFAVVFEDCTTNLALFDAGTVILPILGPDESITLYWDVHICAVGCSSPYPLWFYGFNYEKSCPEGDQVGGSGSNTVGGVPTLMVDSITYNIGEPLMDDGVYLMNYELSSSMLVDSNGVLTLDFNLPCGMGWGNSPVILGGQAPFNTTQTDLPDGTSVVTLEYQMPIGVFNVSSDFLVTWDCDDDCLELPECDTVFVTDCPILEICTAAGLPQIAPMSVITTINLDTLNNNACGIQECQEFELVYDCPSDSICFDTIVGWLDYEMDFFRTNLGLADNDDNRFADPGGVLDLNQIRQDRAMAGDTIQTSLAGTVHMDIPGGTLQNGTITVSFEAHTIDDGIEGFQALNFEANRFLMTQQNGFENLGASLRIVDASTGNVYECELGAPAVFDTLYARLVEPNTRPENVLDEVLFMTFSYSISPALLNALGCDIPTDFVYEEADSLIFTAHHKIRYNVVEFGSPRVVNLRTGTSVGFFNNTGQFQLNPFVCNCQSLPWQLSGYRYLISPGLYNMPPCEASDSPGGTRFDFVLGTGNFFPFEFRNFAVLEDWLYSFDPSISLLESELVFLQLQGGNTIYTDVPLDANLAGVYYDIDVDEFQDPLLDEGFSMRFRHLWEMPCQEHASQALNVHAIVTLANSIPEENPVDTIINGFGTFRPLRPQLDIFPDNTHYISLDNTAEWELDLISFLTGFNDPAPNVWIQPISNSGLLSDFALINLTTGANVPFANGFFQIGNYDPGANNTFQLIAQNASCDNETLTVLFGWNCETYEGSGNPCWQGQITLTADSPPGEIEMDLMNPPTPVDLCDTIQYHTVEIFNAQIGTVYDIILDVIIPAGFIIAPGTAEISFPTGAPWQSIPDPVDLGGGNMQWNLSQLNTDLEEAGLKGFNQSPDHSVSIRFKGLTECGFISASQLIFKATGEQNCDIPTNILSKASDPIHITGVVPPYIATIDIVPLVPQTVACGDDFTFSVNMSASGVTLDSDSIFIILPPGVNYVPGSYMPGANASLSNPIIDTSNGSETLKWSITPSLGAGSLINFDLTVGGFGVMDDCDVQHLIQVKAVQKQEAICVADGTLCEVLAETGSSTIEINTTNPDFLLQNFIVNMVNGIATYNLSIVNNGSDTEQPLVVEFYLDNDNNGVPSAGDVLLLTSTHTDPVAQGALVTMMGNLNVDYDQICDLIAYIDPNQNCVCEEEVISPTGLITNELAPLTVCSGVNQDIGIANIPGHTYSWDPPFNITTANTAMTTFNFNNTGDIPVEFEYTLTDDDGMGCVIETTQEIIVPNLPGIITNDTTICEGSEITLVASPGMSYNWSGSGITDPSLQNQTVTITQNETYNLTVTDNNGCEGIDAVNISIDLLTKIDSVLTICEGDVQNVYGTLVSQETIVTATLPNASGCDTIVTVQVFVQGTFGSSDLIVCKGDSTGIPGEPGVYVDEFDVSHTSFDLPTDLMGCDSSHTYIVVVADTPSVSLEAFGCVPDGENFVFQNQLPGNLTYVWSVLNGTGVVDCDTCSNPVFTPAGDSTIYQVLISNADGCTNSYELNLQVLPACGVQALEGKIPNVFTPDNDGMNDRFGVIEDEQLEKLFDGNNNSINMRIWNRWGQKVFDSERITDRWDGRFEEKDSQSEVYVYTIEVKCGEEVRKITGDVTLLR